jgi:fructose-1,6-bisphosphatase I
VRRYVDWLQALDDDQRAPLGHRYIGSMIADFHRNLLRGGVFLYPGDMRQPAGKLRLTYEAQPLAFIAAQAGGYASDGLGDILDIQPKTLHQCVPVFIGSRVLVEKAESFMQEYDQDYLAEYQKVR